MEDVALLVLQWLPIDEQPPREMLPYELPPRDAVEEWYAIKKDPEPAKKNDYLDNGDDEADEEGEENSPGKGKQQENVEASEGIEEAKGMRYLPL